MNLVNNKFFCGIDPSLSATGLIIIDNDLNIVEQKLICTKKQNIYQDIEYRILNIIEKLQCILTNKDKDKIKMVLIEGISYGSTGDGAAQLAALNYAIRIWLLLQNIPYKDAPPSAVKKFVTGKGNCKKNLMLKEVYKKWNVDFSDDNLCDAYALARLAKHNYMK